jgi:16S rRNA processing protein RimM
VSLIPIGKLGRPHGIRGELTLEAPSLGADDLLAMREFTWQGRGGATRPLILTGARPLAPRVLVRFAGVDSRETAAGLVNGTLLAERALLPDPGPGHAWTFQLVGCQVRTDDGRALGRLEDVVRTAAHPIYVVRGEREWLLPATGDVVKNVDLEARVITVTLIPGLEEL